MSIFVIILFFLFAVGKAEEITSLPTFVDETTASSGLPGDDDGDEVTTPSSSSAAPPQQYGRERFISLLSSEMNPNQAVDSQEYYRFLDSLSKTGEVRRFKFDRLNEARNRARPKLSAASLEFRKFNYTVDAQQEEFDCDLNLLASCESSLLEKIEMIEDHHVVFPLQSIEDDVPTSQEDILELCRSIDHEFQCLFDYAEKCEHKMTAATFAILKYIITKNNETIMSCRQRERDWLGWDQYVDDEPDHEFEELMLPKSSTPCIHQAEVFACINRTFGADFDPLKTLVHTRSQCDQVLRYERCLKQALFERHPATVMCSLQEKELSVHYLLNVIHFPSTEVDVESGDYVYCKNIADRINKQYSYLDDNEQALDMSSEPNKEEDRAFGMTNMLRFYYNCKLLSLRCCQCR